MNRLANKTAVIVGGGQTPGQDIGNGRAMAIRFAQEGAAVFVTARHLESAQETVRMIREQVPEAVAGAGICDITDEESVKAMLAEARDFLGRIDILVNNVGICLTTDRGIFGMDSNDFDFVMDTNVKGAMFLYRNVYDYMKENGGAIVQTASVAGVSVYRGDGPILYNLSKCAMIRLGEATAARFAAVGIRVNTIVLGFVQTAMAITSNMKRSGRAREEVIENRNKMPPLKGGQGTAWDTANAALFLASDEAKFITGANLPVDGGQTVMKG